MPRLTRVIPIQQAMPIRIGFPPVLTSLMMFVCSPMAAIAMIMKNLDNSFSGANTSIGTPTAAAIVVMMDAPIKNRMKKGNTCLMDTCPPPSSSAL